MITKGKCKISDIHYDLNLRVAVQNKIAISKQSCTYLNYNYSFIGSGLGTLLCIVAMIGLLFMYDHNLRSIENPGTHLKKNTMTGVAILCFWIGCGILCRQYENWDFSPDIKKGLSLLIMFASNCANWLVLYSQFVHENHNMGMYCRSQRQLVPEVMPWHLSN